MHRSLLPLITGEHRHSPDNSFKAHSPIAPLHDSFWLLELLIWTWLMIIPPTTPSQCN